jgi:hypothetical protein
LRPELVLLGSMALGLVLMSPCLTTGWVADDFFHQLMLRSDPGVRGMVHRPFDLFRFASGDARTAHQLMNEGVFAWWTDPHAVLAFFRPLASLTHWADYRLWPNSAFLMHAHSLAWFALLLLVVRGLFRRFSECEGAPALALILFAIDDAHAPAVSWIANRNQLVALTLALPSLIVHDRFRSDRFRAGAWLGPLLFACGLLAGESALIAGAYLAAYAIALDRGCRVRRGLALLPYAGVTLVWGLCYHALGYGAKHSGLYADPLHAPLSFAGALLERLPVLALSQLALPWADFWEIYPLTFPWLVYAVGALAWTVLAGFAALVYPVWRSSRMVRFWGVGALFSLVPVCASFPHDRLLLGASVGAMPLLSELFCRTLRERGPTPRRIALGVLGVLHLFVAPVLLPIRAASVSEFNRILDAVDRTIPHGPEVAEQHVVLVNPPLDPVAAYFPVYRQARGEPRPRSLLWLNSGVTDLTLTGVDANTLRVRAKDGFLSSSTQWMLRDPHRPPRRSDTIRLSAATIQVSKTTADGRPLEVVVRFRAPLRSEHLVFFEWRAGGYVPFTPPPPGESVTVAALDFVSVLFGRSPPSADSVHRSNQSRASR